MATTNQYVQAILAEYNRISELRQKDRNLELRFNAFQSIPTVNGESDGYGFEKVLPKHLLPSNVGDLSEVTWPFSYEMTFDFYDYANNTLKIIPDKEYKSQIQVSNESAFCITSIYRTFPRDYDSAYGLPMTIQFEDTQSARQFNGDNPIPIQSIGCQGEPTFFDIPKLILPNATFTAKCKSWYGKEIDYGDKSGKHSFILQGFRIRIADMQKVFSALFQ